MSVVVSFFQWWTGELLGLFPALRSRARTADRQPTIALDGDGSARLLGWKGTASTTPPRPLREVIGDLRRVSGRGRKPVAVRLRTSDCLVRMVELPAAASRSFAQMLLLDLERSTPLKARDVFSAYVVEGERTGGGMARVRHLVVKARTIEPVLMQLCDAGFEVVAVDCWNGEGTAALPVNFLGEAANGRQRSRFSFTRWAAPLAASLAVTAALIHWDRQTKALASLTVETVRLAESARATRGLVERARSNGAGLEQLRRLKGDRTPATMILEEVTRLLPDTAWLQEFHLDNDVIEIAGLAVSAASLLPAFERSALFHETSFTAPLRLEAAGERERFRLRTRLKPAASQAGAPRREAGQ